MSWHTFWLILHILGAVVAFGPTYTFPLISARGKKDPRHAPFAAEVSVAISERFVIPAAISLAVSGLALMFIEELTLADNAWLVISIVLYFIALGYSLFSQTPTGKELVAALKAGQSAGSPPAGASGPPPSTAVLGKRMAVGGMILTFISLAIFVLMIWKPGT